jgi:hypothetical protein
MKSKTLGLISVVAALVVATSIVSLLTAPAAFALQQVGQSNRAGGNTQTGLVNVGNAQVQVGANVCALSVNC